MVNEVVKRSTNCNKIFGPVLSVARFKTEEEAIALANDTSYGLGAGLHSSEIDIPVQDFPIDS